MEQAWAAFSRALGLELEGKDLTALHMALRAVVVFVLSIAMLKVGDKRFMGKSTALDVMLGIVFGSTVSRAITGNAPFFPALVGALALVLLHWLFAAVAFRSHGFGRLVKGRNRLLVRDGEIQWDAMRKSHVTTHDLEEALRAGGEEPDVTRVKAAHLERNGDISVIMKG
ncbi:MAG TPA: YetF domain-containing protein [Pyrinomonadaceae bacterium]|nr:YetF domain-containing protein [Pyrinomonadaceae bacterium]